MKKFFAIALALVLTLALAVTCFAEVTGDKTGLKTGESATQNITVTYTAGDTDDTKVYAVDVKFGALSFEYTAEGNSGWNVEEHTYTTVPASWNATGNTVTVTNHSNDGITATFSIDFGEINTVTASYTGEGVTGNVLALGSAETNNAAVAGTVTVTLDGSITEQQAGSFTLTVAIAAQA